MGKNDFGKIVLSDIVSRKTSYNHNDDNLYDSYFHVYVLCKIEFTGENLIIFFFFGQMVQ